jgi:hypothetical protein
MSNKPLELFIKGLLTLAILNCVFAFHQLASALKNAQTQMRFPRRATLLQKRSAKNAVQKRSAKMQCKNAVQKRSAKMQTKNAVQKRSAKSYRQT